MAKKLLPLTWSNKKIKLKDLQEWDKNPVLITEEDKEQLAKSIDKFGNVLPYIAASPIDKNGKADLLDGHQRKTVQFQILHTSPNKLVDVRVPSRKLTNKEREEIVIRLRSNTGQFDFEKLKKFFNRSDLISWGMKDKELSMNGFTLDQAGEGTGDGAGGMGEAEIDRAEELLDKWKVKTGDVFAVGDHRIICGDSTDPKVIKELMRKEKAVLIEADPPYGMGKENEGIENDNLYGKKLDEFQMKWWTACRPYIVNNGSSYIWGNSDDLWRLWYLGGLRDSERLTYRNEITWDKQDGTNPTLRVNGKNFEGMRSHYQSERCLFFMLGEQGFNNNSDNYWTGWDSIRLYLLGEANKMRWNPKDIERICGVGMYGHWFTTSQWTFPRVTGDDRLDHATPKPVEMIERIFRISSPADSVILVPFGGTAPELPAAQLLGRKCRVVELKPEYVAVSLERMATAFPKIKIKKL